MRYQTASSIMEKTAILPRVCADKDNDLIVTYHALLHAVTGVYRVISTQQLGPTKIDGKIRFYYEVKRSGDQPYRTYGNFNIEKFFKLNPKFDQATLGRDLTVNIPHACNEKFVFRLTKGQLQFLQSSLQEPTYYKSNTQPAMNEIESISKLLDFYSNRATAFIGLFIASLFGLVSFLAIVPNAGLTN